MGLVASSAARYPAKSSKRSAAVPDLPTVNEALGLKDFEADQWYGVVAPAGTPADIVARLNQAINAALNSAELKKRLGELPKEVLPCFKQSIIDFENDRRNDCAPAPQAARLTRPVLLAHGEDDSTVPYKQFKLMQAATAKSTLVEPLVFAEEGHGFDKVENRQKWYETLDAFLTKHNPAE